VNVKAERVAPETAKQVLQHAGVSLGDLITPETMKRLRDVTGTIDEHLHVEYKKADGGIVLLILPR
jgi:hypothetical protein